MSWTGNIPHIKEVNMFHVNTNQCEKCLRMFISSTLLLISTPVTPSFTTSPISMTPTAAFPVKFSKQTSLVIFSTPSSCYLELWWILFHLHWPRLIRWRRWESLQESSSLLWSSCSSSCSSLCSYVTETSMSSLSLVKLQTTK